MQKRRSEKLKQAGAKQAGGGCSARREKREKGSDGKSPTKFSRALIQFLRGPYSVLVLANVNDGEVNDDDGGGGVRFFDRCRRRRRG